MPQWIMNLLPIERQRRARVEAAAASAEKASDNLTKAIDQVFEDHPDPIPYLVHIGMDYKRKNRRPGDIG